MGAPNNQKHELCCQALASGLTQREAYRAGGYKYNQATASRFFNRPEIKARVQEIINERAEMSRVTAVKAAEEAGTDRAWINRTMRHTVLLALRGHPRHHRDGKVMRDEAGNPMYSPPQLTPAVRGLELLGREQGMFIERAEIGGAGDFERMSDSDLGNEIARAAERIGLPAEAVKLLEFLGGVKPESEDEE